MLVYSHDSDFHSAGSCRLFFRRAIPHSIQYLIGKKSCEWQPHPRNMAPERPYWGKAGPQDLSATGSKSTCAHLGQLLCHCQTGSSRLVSCAAEVRSFSGLFRCSVTRKAPNWAVLWEIGSVKHDTKQTILHVYLYRFFKISKFSFWSDSKSNHFKPFCVAIKRRKRNFQQQQLCDS